MPDSITLNIGDEFIVDWTEPAEGTQLSTGTMKVSAIQETPIRVITAEQI
jgi:hypothetical protein